MPIAVGGGHAIRALAPGAPLLSSIASGPGNATRSFSPPASNGGAPISSYTATCTATGSHTVRVGQRPFNHGQRADWGVIYNCSLTATNGEGLTGIASLFLPDMPAPGNSANIVPILLLLLESADA